MLLALVIFKNNEAHLNHHLKTWVMLYNTEVFWGVKSKVYEYLKENQGLDDNLKFLLFEKTTYNRDMFKV